MCAGFEVAAAAFAGSLLAFQHVALADPSQMAAPTQAAAPLAAGQAATSGSTEDIVVTAKRLAKARSDIYYRLCS